MEIKIICFHELVGTGSIDTLAKNQVPLLILPA